MRTNTHLTSLKRTDRFRFMMNMHFFVSVFLHRGEFTKQLPKTHYRFTIKKKCKNSYFLNRYFYYVLSSNDINAFKCEISKNNSHHYIFT